MITIDEAVAEMRRKGDIEWDDGEQWSEEDIAVFERDAAVYRERKSPARLKLPKQLKEFLLKHGSVGAETNNAFVINFPSGARAKNEMVSVGHAVENMINDSRSFIPLLYGPNHDQLMPGRVPNGYVFMGTAEGGHAYLLMDGTNPENNAVYIWGLAYDPWGEGDNTLGIGKCADTLAEFLYNLRPYEDL